jgi:scyllo-inositol 2-dehydrogenase (NAD+)
MSRLGVAVVGVGTLGKRHAENIRYAIPEARLVATVDRDIHRASRVASELGAEQAAERLEDVVTRKDVQAVVIASPSKFHAEAIQLTAQHGKHAFCEKPLGLTIEEADEALKAVAKAGVLLQLGFMRRFDPAYANAKKRIDAGEIGEPIMFKSLGRDRQPPPDSFYEGGINGTLFSDSAIHDFDLARWMMGDEVAEVHTYAGLLASPELARFREIDLCLVNLRFSRGGIGNVEAFRKSNYGYDIRTEITGTKGTIQIGYLNQTPNLTLTASGPSYDIVDHWLVRFADAYLFELRDFVRKSLAGGSALVTGEDGKRALMTALAAERSYRESRPVAIALRDDLSRGRSTS